MTEPAAVTPTSNGSRDAAPGARGRSIEPVAPASPAHPRSAGGIAIRIVVAAAVVGGVIWYLQHRSEKKTAAAMAGSGGSADHAGGRSGGSGSAEGRVVPVQVAIAERKDLPIWVEGLGSVAAYQQVTVKAQVDGKLDKVLFTEGQVVKKGDLLVQIDPRPFLVMLHAAQGALARDQAQLVAAKANYERMTTLAAQNLIAQNQVEAALAQQGQFEGAVTIDRSQIESAQLQLDYASVRAPLDGITGVRQVDAGNIIHAADPNGLVVITAIDPAAVLFTVPQDRLSNVSVALAHGDVVVEAYNRDGTQKLGTGKLAVLDNQINSTTATLRLKALLPNPDRALWPNEFVKARMLIETRKGALVIPAVAVQHSPQGTYVYVVGPEKTALMTPVVLALTAGDTAIIQKGLEGGEQVVIEGQNQVRPNGKVEVVQPGGHPDAAAGAGSGSGHGSGRGRHGGSGSGGSSAGPPHVEASNQ